MEEPVGAIVDAVKATLDRPPRACRGHHANRQHVGGRRGPAEGP
jgi:hypothetical protein